MTQPRLQRDPAPGSSLYGGPSPDDAELALYQISFLLVDLTTFTANMLQVGQQFEVKGHWLYCDPSTCGAAQVTLYGENDDSKSFAFSPGQVIKTTFDRIRVFSGPSVSGALMGTIVNDPTIRLFYGMGTCPFEPIAQAQGSTSPVAVNVTTFSTDTVALATYTAAAMPSGASVDVSAEFSQLTGAAETSILRTRLVCNLYGGGTFYLVPDGEFTQDISVAGVGTARVRANWATQRLPRGTVTISAQCSNYGNAATNVIGSGVTAENILIS